ncbi:MAG: phage virion morphogenesis protein [Synergistaceae bacterium]|nr:phage virion morphogenesis protein [Synergistaceae bacterium]MBR0249445.1 phage virion morphogenesis protein [Synergistaceae bacterium]
MQINIHVDGINKLRQKLNLTADKLQSMRTFWELVGMYIQRQTTRERFGKEQSPDGTKWKKLASSTIKHRMKRHKNGNMKILQDTGALRQSIAFEAGDNSVKVGSKLKYARTHQFGRGNIPARPFLGVTDSEKKHITDMFRAYIKRHITGGS